MKRIKFLKTKNYQPERMNSFSLAGKLKTNSGFGLVESVIGISVAVLVFLAIGQVTILALKASEEKDIKLKALNLAEEGIEVVKNIRDDGWTTNIANLNFGNTYYATTSAGQWILTETNPGVIDNKFTRTIIIDSVSRDLNDDIIALGGADDPGTKLVTSTVYWEGLSRNVQLVTYIANILND